MYIFAGFDIFAQDAHMYAHVFMQVYLHKHMCVHGHIHVALSEDIYFTRMDQVYNSMCVQGPTYSRYLTRTRTALTGWHDVAVAGVSCISEVLVFQ